jgi:Ca-activated chloride channel family protein
MGFSDLWVPVGGLFYKAQFASPDFLWLTPLCFLPIIYDRFARRRGGVGVASVEWVLPAGQSARISIMARFGVMARLLAIFLIVIALARPQIHDGKDAGRREGIDIMLAIDTSGSMRARDFEVGGQRPDRLEVIKSVISDFIAARGNDRVGMVVFGSEAYTQAPLTLDHEVLQKFLDHVSIGMAGDGTAIGDGLATAVRRLKDSHEKGRVIVLLTDGANNAGRIDPVAAAQAAKAFNIRVHTIGVGSEGVVPIVQDGRVFHIKADIDEKSLRAIADATGGIYRRATDTDALVGVYKEIDKLEKKKLEGPEKSTGRDVFPAILALVMALLTAELIWRGSRFRRLPV